MTDVVEFVDETELVAAEYSTPVSVSPPSVVPDFSDLTPFDKPFDPSPEAARTALTIQQLVDDGIELLSPPLYAISLDETRAKLFRHYITKVGPWVCDMSLNFLLT